MILSFSAAGAQEKELAPAQKGTTYGTVAVTNTVTITPDELEQKASSNEYNGRITGKVTEVCQAMGCWFKIEKGDGTTLMVKTKDHSFFLPQNLVGKTVAIDGTAKIKEVSEAQRKHFAEDGGKSKEEIKIREKLTKNQRALKTISVYLKNRFSTYIKKGLRPQAFFYLLNSLYCF